MLSHSTIAAALVLAKAVAAFHLGAGTACTGTGTACSFGIAIRGENQLVNGFCAPNGFCADDGATCSTDDECYNFCGTDGVCGGASAVCNSDDATAHASTFITCNTPAFVCLNNGNDGSPGICTFAASAAASRRGRRARGLGHTITNREYVVSKYSKKRAIPDLPARSVPVPEGIPTEAFALMITSGEKEGTILAGARALLQG